MKILLISLSIFLFLSTPNGSDAQGTQKPKSVVSKTTDLKYLRFENGEHPTSFLKRNPLIVNRLKVLLGKIYPDFYTGLNVSSGFKRAGHFQIVSGISPHSLGLDSYLGFSENYALSNPNSHIYVIVSGLESGPYKRFYSTQSNKKVPIEMAV